jgi:hypothetical protein
MRSCRLPRSTSLHSSGLVDSQQHRHCDMRRSIGLGVDVTRLPDALDQPLRGPHDQPPSTTPQPERAMNCSGVGARMERVGAWRRRARLSRAEEGSCRHRAAGGDHLARQWSRCSDRETTKRGTAFGADSDVVRHNSRDGTVGRRSGCRHRRQSFPWSFCSRRQ